MCHLHIVILDMYTIVWLGYSSGDTLTIESLHARMEQIGNVEEYVYAVNHYDIPNDMEVIAVQAHVVFSRFHCNAADLVEKRHPLSGCTMDAFKVYDNGVTHIPIVDMKRNVQLDPRVIRTCSAYYNYLSRGFILKETPIHRIMYTLGQRDTYASNIKDIDSVVGLGGTILQWLVADNIDRPIARRSKLMSHMVTELITYYTTIIEDLCARLSIALRHNGNI